MTNMLLDDSTLNLIFGIVLVVLAVAGAIVLALRLNKKMNSVKSIDWKNYNAKGQIKKHIPVLWPKEVEFYQMFRSVLPAEFMIIPKMGVNEIVKPNGNLVLYNAIKNEHVDFCVVKISNMEPIAVLDTYYPSITDRTIQEINPAVKKALESVDIPVISYEILDVPYDKSKVFATFLDAIDPVSLAELKNSKK